MTIAFMNEFQETSYMWVVPGSLVVCVTVIWGACLKGMLFGYGLLLWGMLIGWISLATAVAPMGARHGRAPKSAQQGPKSGQPLTAG